MKLKLVALTLIAFASWLVPLQTLAEETSTIKSNQSVREYNPYPQLKVVYFPPKTKPIKQFYHAPIPTSASIPVANKRQSHVQTRLPKESVKQDSGGTYSGRHYSVEEVRALIIQYSNEYGISAGVPLHIAACESGYNQFSRNRNSTASGVFQFLSSTWANQPAGKKGISVFDADANVQAAVWLLAHGKNSMWVCK